MLQFTSRGRRGSQRGQTTGQERTHHDRFIVGRAWAGMAALLLEGGAIA